MGNTSLVGLSMCERIFRKNEINSRKEKRINKKENWAPKTLHARKKKKKSPGIFKKEIQTDRRTEREEKRRRKMLTCYTCGVC